MTTPSAVLRRAMIFLALAALATAVGCGGKQTKPDESNVPNAANADENQMGDSDGGKAMGLHTIHFGFDSATLNKEAKGLLSANAKILKDKSSLKVQIEGHCDQQGGIQYNIALGERRANAAKKYLEDMGISGDRITTISFGKERPIDPGTNDEAYAKNRRDNFVITAR